MSYNKKTGLYTGYIYMIQCSIEPYKKYIGQTYSNIINRWSSHKYNAKKGHKKYGTQGEIGREIRRLGVENFNINSLESASFSTLQELIVWLDEKEAYYINLYDTTNPDKGYNDFTGGRKKYKKTKLELVDQYNFSGNYIATYDKYTLPKEFAYDSVLNACGGMYAQVSGYIWRFAGDPFDKFPLPSEHNKKVAVSWERGLHPISQYDLHGNLIAVYKNAKDTCDKLNFKYKHLIVSACSNVLQHYNGYVFRFEGDSFDEYGEFEQYKTIINDSISYNIPHINHVPIYVYNNIGELIDYSEYPFHLEKKYGVKISAIKDYATKRTATSYKKNIYVFSFEPLPKEEVLLRIEALFKVFVFDKTGNLLERFCNMGELARALRINHSSIKACLQKHRIVNYKDYYISKYLNNNSFENAYIFIPKEACG